MDNFSIDLTEETGLSLKERDKIIRYRHAFHILLQCPWMTTPKLRDELMNVYGISESQAYRDIQTMETIKGTVQNTSREFQLYKINAALDEALDLAITAKDPETIAKVAAVIGKYNMLDKNLPQRIPTDEIIPQPVEYTSDPSILGVKLSDRVKADPQAYIDSLIRKHEKQINLENSIDYTDFEEDGK
jgi:hypothetical protein